MSDLTQPKDIIQIKMAKSEEKNLRKEREDRCIKSISSVSADNNVGNAQNVKIRSGSGKNWQQLRFIIIHYQLMQIG